MFDRLDLAYSPLVVERGDLGQARFACKYWHYSRSVPGGTDLVYSVWEYGQFVGSMLFSYGATRFASPLGLCADEVRELTRVALDKHGHPVSQMLARAIKHLRRDKPQIRALVSYSDPEQGHHGGIYQATNWFYDGTETCNGRQSYVVVDGEKLHRRTAYCRYGTASVAALRARYGPGVHSVTKLAKHRYCLPLDRGVRKRLLSIERHAYPKRKDRVAA